LKLIFDITFDREADGRWIAEVDDFPGVIAYGATHAEAERNVSMLACKVIEEKIKNGELIRERER